MKDIYLGATRTHLSVPLLDFQMKFLYSLLRQEPLTETAIGHLEERFPTALFLGAGPVHVKLSQ